VWALDQWITATVDLPPRLSPRDSDRPIGVVADEQSAAAGFKGIIEGEGLAARGAQLDAETDHVRVHVDRRSAPLVRRAFHELVGDLNPHSSLPASITSASTPVGEQAARRQLFREGGIREIRNAELFQTGKQLIRAQNGSAEGPVAVA
jgi:hypothetical protein